MKYTVLAALFAVTHAQTIEKEAAFAEPCDAELYGNEACVKEYR